jgi:membrane protein YqaA with SNARE-associated domain
MFFCCDPCGFVLVSCAMKHESTTPATDDLSQARATRNPLRKLYYWTLHWAATPYALPALAFLSFAESSFFPVPPDVLLIALCFSTPARWFKLALWCTVASVAGGLLGYFIGWGLWETVGHPIVRMYNGESVVEAVRAWYENYGFFGVLAAAVTPIPYKVFTIASGMMSFDLLQFVLASTIGRGMRFFLVAGLIRFFGAKIKPFMERHFELAASLLVVLAILGFFAIKYL